MTIWPPFVRCPPLLVRYIPFMPGEILIYWHFTCTLTFQSSSLFFMLLNSLPLLMLIVICSKSVCKWSRLLIMYLLIFHNFVLFIVGKFNASTPVLNLWSFCVSQVVFGLTQNRKVSCWLKPPYCIPTALHMCISPSPFCFFFPSSELLKPVSAMAWVSARMFPRDSVIAPPPG